MKPIREKTDDFEFLYACEYGKFEITQLLLQRGANVHAEDGYALRWASWNGHVEVVRLLLQHGADVHTREDHPLCYASASGSIEVVRLLLQHGANVHARGDYPIQMAVGRRGTPEMTHLLIQYGANVNAKNGRVLDIVCRYEHLEITMLLLQYGADISKVTDTESKKFALNCQKILDFKTKIDRKRKEEAQRKIYFWMIEKLYRQKTESCTSLLLKKYNELTAN